MHYRPIQTTIALAALIAIVFTRSLLFAQDLTSTNFIIRDPLVGTGGSFGTSTNFQAFGSGDMTMIGTGSSASFEGRYGFLYYPYAVSGTLSAVLNGQDVDLTWGASTSGLGWNISGYNVGISTTSGSGYSFTNVGNVITYTYENLTPGTYYFVVQTLDTFGNIIATSNEDSVVVPQALTFSLSDSSVGFGSLAVGGARYATGDTLGSGTLTSAHTMSFSTNAPGGYAITYRGPTLTSGGNTISAATITGDTNGTPGSEEFALSLETTGDATIPSAYQKGLDNWSFAPSVTTVVASETGVTTTETMTLYYIANTAPQTEAGSYSTAITYIATPTF